ncbi:beta-lactamase family protein [Stigmatella hybrida]|uniref:beta-lactamase family protein n=1 Tax=Stigmatella hybrida TaxID=394097 RepID=UPI001CDA6576|nr:beta-lactamase family protein [Stigmatella hybrida]
MALTPPGAIRDALLRPPLPAQAKTSSAFRPAQQPHPIPSRRAFLRRLHRRRRRGQKDLWGGWKDAPEFAQADKSRITVHQLLAHKASLPAFDEWMEPVKLAGLDSLARGLAWQAPAWEPGTRHGDPSFTSG